MFCLFLMFFYLLIHILFELFSNKSYSIPDGYKIIQALHNFIKSKTQISLPIIYELINKKTLEINKTFNDLTISKNIKIEKIKNIILNIKNDTNEIYKYNLDASVIRWNDFLKYQADVIKKNKEEIHTKIMSEL